MPTERSWNSAHRSGVRYTHIRRAAFARYARRSRARSTNNDTETTMRAVASLVAWVLCCACASALAQAPQPTQRIRGDIVAVDGLNLQVKARTGENVAIKLADNYTV